MSCAPLLLPHIFQLHRAPIIGEHMCVLRSLPQFTGLARARLPHGIGACMMVACTMVVALGGRGGGRYLQWCRRLFRVLDYSFLGFFNCVRFLHYDRIILSNYT